MRLGLFGGTFDPPHVGHLIVAQDVCAALRLDRLLFVPAAVPPHKRDRPVTPPALRLEMLHAALDDDARFAIEELELRRDGPSYSVDTLRELRRREPDARLFFVIGADQWREFGTWREPREIAVLASVVVISRGGDDPAQPAGGADIPHERVDVTRIDVSSTEIRRRVAADEPIRYLVPEAVRAVIERERLYR